MSKGKRKSEMRDWIKREVTIRSSIESGDFCREVVERFKSDPEFVERFFEEEAYRVAYRYLIQEIKATRGGVVKLGSEEIPRDQFELQARGTFADIFKGSGGKSYSSWMENDGISYEELRIMTAGQLRRSAYRRNKRVQTELRRIRFLEYLAEGLEDSQTVGEVYTEEDLKRIYEEINEKESVV